MQTKKQAVFAIIHFHSGLVASVTTCPIKRANIPEYPIFGLPGGKVDEGETHHQALARECYEEGWGGVLDFSNEPVHQVEHGGFDCYWYAAIRTTSEAKILFDYKEKHRGIMPVVMHYSHINGLDNDLAFSKFFPEKFKKYNSATIFKNPWFNNYETT